MALVSIFVYVPWAQFLFETAAPPWLPALIPALCVVVTITTYNITRKAMIRRWPKFVKSLHW